MSGVAQTVNAFRQMPHANCQIRNANYICLIMRDNQIFDKGKLAI